MNRGLMKPVIAAPPVGGQIISAWDFESGSGNTALDYKSNNDLTINGAAWDNNGKIGKCLSFDGANDYLEAADHSSLDITGALSLEAWFYTSSPTVNNAGIVAKYANVSPWLVQRSYELYVKDGDSRSRALGFALSGDGNYSSANTLETAADVFSFNVWNHAVCVFSPDDNYMKIYVNGSEVATKTVSLTSIHSGTAPLWIGAQYYLLESPTISVFFNGKLDMPRLRNFALSATQVATLYNNGNGLSHSQLTF